MTCDEAKSATSLIKYGEILLRKGMLEEARGALKEAIRREAGSGPAHYTLAVVHALEGCPEEAAGEFRLALEIHPNEVRSLVGLGAVLERLGSPDEAAACYLEGVRADPLNQDAQVNLALLLQGHGRFTLAQRHLEEALRVQPDAVRLTYNLANVFFSQGKCLEAVALYREVLSLDPEHLSARQNLLYALHYSPSFSDARIFAEHLEAAGRKPFLPPTLPSRPLAPGGRIRVGYLSPDLRDHAVASFIEPVLLHHDRRRFQIFCYANLPRPDRTTERLKGISEEWRDIFRIGDAEAAALISADGIDILVDLAGHTSGNRLPLFARRAAALQVTWLGYPGSTGMAQMDYRITDRFADPPGMTDRFHSERLIRLERSFCSFLPPETSPAVAPLPLSGSGRVTFGSFNNLAKVTPQVIALWARLLRAVPGSRLVLKCRPFADPELGARVREAFCREQVAEEAIELHPGNGSAWEHLAQYARIDIALDTFPYNGTTTSCEALWMGVPVVTLAGSRHAARTGVSILTNCGLDFLVAQSPDQYLTIARGLAQDAARLGELRTGLRNRMRLSPLLDGAGVTRELEAAFTRILAEATQGGRVAVSSRS